MQVPVALASETRDSPQGRIACLQPSCWRPDRSSSPRGASMLVPRWRRTAPTAESHAAPIAHRQQRPCQRRRYWLFVKAATARPLLVQASTSSTPRGTARGSIAQRAIVGARVASCAASPSELRLHRHGRGGACLRAIAPHRCKWRALPRPARLSISAWSPSQDLNGPAASITAPARSARSFATDTTARPARPAHHRVAPKHDRAAPERRRQCFHGNAPGDDRRSVPVLDPAAPPEPQDGHGPYRPARTTWRSPSRPRLRLDHVADAAPRLHEVVDLAPPGHQPPRRMSQRAPASSLSTRRTVFPEPAATRQRREPRSAFRLTGNRPWPHCGPMEHPDRADPSSSQIPENCANAANFWIPASGRSRTRTWDLFLIRKTFCPPQSPQLALNPCKPPRRRQRKGTAGDWTGQPGGPVVAPRQPFEGMVSYDPVAVIMPTTRSGPDAPETGRCGPA